jgi:hypothetical protein
VVHCSCARECEVLKSELKRSRMTYPYERANSKPTPGASKVLTARQVFAYWFDIFVPGRNEFGGAEEKVYYLQENNCMIGKKVLVLS